jgi:hypothetical protein
MPTRYYLSLPDPTSRNGGDFAFRAQGAEAVAAELQDALRSDALFSAWKRSQPDPDAVDPALGATDPTATVAGQQRDLHIDLVVTTSIPGSVFKQRLRLLAGNTWKLTDVKSA